MSIQMRQGNDADFDPSKMLPGEWAVSTDKKIIYMCFSPGDVRRMATYEEMVENINSATEDVQKMFTADVQASIQNAAQAASSANSAALTADNSAQAANEAANDANNAAERASAAAGGDFSEKTVTFSIPDTYSEPEPGSKVSDLFGSIIRWIKNAADSIITKNILVERTTEDETYVEIKNPLHRLRLNVSATGNAGVYDRTFQKWLIRSDASGNRIIGEGWVEGTVTLSSGWTKNQTNYLAKNEALGLAYLSLGLKGTLSANTHTVVATIPSGFRAGHVVSLEGTGGATGPVQIQINTSGKVDVWGVSAGTDARFTVMYPLAKEV